MELTSWQKKQATLLYHFSSSSYLKGMQSELLHLADYVEAIIDRAVKEDRDTHLKSTRWGDRNTVENWANNAWPHLKDFQLLTSRQISERAMEKYNLTGYNNFARALTEFSTNWASPEEEAIFKKLLENVSNFSSNIDLTLDKYSRASRWNDFSIAISWEKLRHEFVTIPKFRVRSDIIVKSNTIPNRTGVYVSAKDPNANLQFAWQGGKQGILLLGSTLNDLGLTALAEIGRARLWIDNLKMMQFAHAHGNDASLRADPFYTESLLDADLAPSLIARNSRAEIDGEWLFVELINDEYEDIEAELGNDITDQLKILGGRKCPRDGYYFTPAREHSRTHFAKGTVMPTFETGYGLTIWQWDAYQD